MRLLRPYGGGSEAGVGYAVESLGECGVRRKEFANAFLQDNNPISNDRARYSGNLRCSSGLLYHRRRHRSSCLPNLM